MARSKESRSAGTPATVALTRAGVPFTTHPYAHDPAAPSYGLEAAEALGLPPEQVFKTLFVTVDDRPAVAVVPVSRQLDLKAVASAVGGKRATMADPDVAERASGYVVGGISPLGQRRAHPTVIDVSARTFSVVYVSGGRRGLDVGVAPEDLARLTSAVWASVAR